MAPPAPAYPTFPVQQQPQMPMGYVSGQTGGMHEGGIPNFAGTKNGLMVILVGLIIQLCGPFAAIATAFLSNAISFAGTAIILLGLFMIYFAIKRGEIQIPDTTKLVNMSIMILVVGLVMYGIGFVIMQQAESALEDYEDAEDEDEQVDHLRKYIDAQLFGSIMTFIGRLLSFMAPGFAMLGIRKECFDEYQGRITTKVIISIVLMVITIFAIVGALLMMRAVIYELDEDSSSEDIDDAGDSLVNAIGAICLGFVLMLIGYIFLMWATTTTYHGLKQVEGEHKRRAAGW